LYLTKENKMELFSPGFFSALLAIVVIDLVLAGDNAIVIALAARGLPAHLRNKAIVWGTVGAIVVRTAMTMIVVWLLKIPGLLLVGGAALLWIAYKLLINPDNHGEGHVSQAASFWDAMKTIVIADAVMGLDNVLAVAGAAHGNFLLVVLGLLISIPIVIGGSKLILSFVQRYPMIIYIGAAVLAWTGVKMMANEPLIKDYAVAAGAYIYLLEAVVIVTVLLAGFRANHVKVRQRVAAKVVDLAAIPVAPPSAAPIETKGGNMMQKVLIPVDGSANSQLAVKHVVNRFISGHGVEVHLLYVSVPFSRHVSSFVSRRNREDYYRDVGLQALQPARDLLNQHNIPHAVHIELGSKAQTINKMAERLHIDEIVIGTARKNTLTRVLEDSVTSKVLETAQVPVEIIVGAEASRWERYGLPAGIGALIAAMLIAAD
jgi:YjbE family integral membrane protein